MIDIRKYEGQIKAALLGLDQDANLHIEILLINPHGLPDGTMNIKGSIREKPNGENLLGYLEGTGKRSKNLETRFFDIFCDFYITIFQNNKLSCNSYLYGSSQGLNGQLNIGDLETQIKLKYKGIQTDPY